MKWIIFFCIQIPLFVFSQTNFEKGQKLFKEGKFTSAQPFFENYLKENTSNLQTIEYLGDIHGNLKNWERTGDLEKINLPTLIISGEFDESTPKVNQTMRDGLKKSEWVLMPGCSHLSHLESPDTYFKFIQNFLDQINMSHPLNNE